MFFSQLIGAAISFVESTSFAIVQGSTAGTSAQLVANAIIESVLTARHFPSLPLSNQRVQVGKRFYVWNNLRGRWYPEREDGEWPWWEE